MTGSERMRDARSPARQVARRGLVFMVGGVGEPTQGGDDVVVDAATPVAGLPMWMTVCRVSRARPGKTVADRDGLAGADLAR